MFIETKINQLYLCLGFVYQSKEFDGAGLSPDNLLSIRDWIGSEEIRFVETMTEKTSLPLQENEIPRVWIVSSRPPKKMARTFPVFRFLNLILSYVEKNIYFENN